MKASDLFLRCLERQDIDTIYGVPGEENADLMISLMDSPIKFIICAHEQTAAFMADMHGRLTGQPGICLSTLGPGATNLATGVANANMDHAPVIAIIGQASTRRLHKESHQNMDAIAMYTPIVKWATTIRNAILIPEVLNKAFKLAISEKPGASVVELPENVAKQSVDAIPLRPTPPPSRSAVNEKLITKTLTLIRRSKRPLILLGATCAREGCDKEMTDFIHKTGIYAATTFMGKGTISSHNPKALQCVGLGMRDIALNAFDKADLVICIGYGMVEWHPEKWNQNHKTIIHIDTVTAEVDSFYLPKLELIGDLKTIISQLTEKLKPDDKRDFPDFANIRQQILDDLAIKTEDDAFPMKPQRILADLRSFMARDDILISDVGAHKMWVARQYPTYKSKTCFIYNGFCSMGGAMPAAFVAKRLHPTKQVVALCGDGGFLMSIQALPVGVRYQIPFIVLVWQDDAYGLIKWKQEMEFHQHSQTDFTNPNLADLARAFGCHALEVASAHELLPALKYASKRQDVPTVIVVKVDASENLKLAKHLGEIISH